MLAQWGQSKSIQSCAIAPGTPRMDSDSRPLRPVKFWIRIRKGTTVVCLEIKDAFISIHPLGLFPDPDLTNAVTFIQL